jgi:Tfp pilus assembly protein FimT
MGATLFELLLVFSLISVFAALTFPAMRSGIAALSSRTARETAFGLFARARALAVQQGGAEIELSARDDRLIIRTSSGAIEHVHNFAEQQVDLLFDGKVDPIVLRYDAYGLGRMMSRTVTFRTRGQIAGLTISSFGRVRRW